MTDEEFRQAVEQYADAVFRVAYSCLNNRADAEDVMQETLLKLYMRAEPFESPDHQRHWLLRVAVNESRHLLRTPWRRRTGPLEADIPFETPEQSGLFQEVMALPPKYRVAIYLHYYEGLAVREIARTMGANSSTVQTWLMRGRGILKTKLKEAES